MCKIADPTEKGVWWNDDTKWVLYSPEDARKIMRAKKNGEANITLESVKSAKYPSGKLYVIDLVGMKQTNVHTGFSRNIKIINPGPAYHQEDAESSDEEDEVATAQMINQSRNSDNIVRMVPSVTVDLDKLTSQCVLVDECNLVLKLPRATAAGQTDFINSLNQKTLKLLLEKLTSKDFIKNVVRQKMKSRESELVWKVCPRQAYVVGREDNPSMYSPFLTQLCKMAEDDRLFVDNLFSIAEKGITAEGDPVEYLFNISVLPTESKIALPQQFTRVLPRPSEGVRVSVYLVMLQSGQRRRSLPLLGGARLHLAELVSVVSSGYPY